MCVSHLVLEIIAIESETRMKSALTWLTNAVWSSVLDADQAGNADHVGAGVDLERRACGFVVAEATTLVPLRSILACHPILDATEYSEHTDRVDASGSR